MPFPHLSAYLNLILFLRQQAIGSLFIKEQISEFGTNNIYNADTLNEMTSTPNEASYLSGFSNGIYQGMVAGDPKAVWLMVKDDFFGASNFGSHHRSRHSYKVEYVAKKGGQRLESVYCLDKGEVGQYYIMSYICS